MHAIKNQTFVFLHDEKLYFDNQNRFNCFDNIKYVFLGKENTFKIEKYDDVIIAKNFSENIEKYKSLTAYTGWYLLWKNKLIDAEYVNFFEYDIVFREDIQKILYDTFEKFPKINLLSYQSIFLHDYWFLGCDLLSKNFLDKLKYYYDFDGKDFLNNFGSDVEVGITLNQTIDKKTFESFMDWINPIVDDIKHDEMAGHYIERCLPLFILYRSLHSVICKNALYHLRLDSHGTQKISESYKLANCNTIEKLQAENSNVIYKRIKKMHL
jgi:hypothetical protein